MIEPKILIMLFEQNASTLKKYTDGLTHEDSLLQMPSGGNCLNWVVGHIISARHRVLDMLGESPLWTDDIRAAYRMGSAPITLENREIARPFETLLAEFEATQETIMAGLRCKTFEDMIVVLEGFDQPIGQRIAYFAWHEGYHVGQTEYLRQLAGSAIG